MALSPRHRAVLPQAPLLAIFDKLVIVGVPLHQPPLSFFRQHRGSFSFTIRPMRQSIVLGQRQPSGQFQAAGQTSEIRVQRFDEPDEENRFFASFDLLQASEPIPIAGFDMPDTAHRPQGFLVLGVGGIQCAGKIVGIAETRKRNFFFRRPRNRVRGRALPQTTAKSAYKPVDRIPDAEYHPVPPRNVT